jgi:Fic family protein
VDGHTDDDLGRRLALADAAYAPFAPLSDWLSEPVGLGSWTNAAGRLADTRARTPVEAVRAALDEVRRAAAIDTGAIEGLYATDRGFTMSVARNVISLDQAEVERGPDFRRHFQAQLAGFEMAQQLATGDEVATEAALRELHRVTCAGQGTHRVLTAIGVQERTLALGSYKSEPNHVQLGDGSFHSYAPVGRVPDEMHRLVTEMRSRAFLDAPAVVQAAFAHHAFTAVHPFADGNGRVARLVASVWLVRAASIPLWVEPTDRDRYLDALGEADRGDRAAFLRLVTSVTLRLLRELTLVLEQGPEPRRSTAEEEAARAAAAVLMANLQAAVAGVQGVSVVHPYAYVEPELDGIEVPIGAALALRQSTAKADRPIAVGIDHHAEDESRFCVLIFDRDYLGSVIRREALDSRELIPEPSPSARRRLAEVARLAVAELRTDHRGRPTDP